MSVLDGMAELLIAAGRAAGHTEAELIEHAEARAARAKNQRYRLVYGRALEILQKGNA